MVTPDRVAEAKIRHATMLARTDSEGRPLYRVTGGGNVVRTRPITQRLKAKVLERDGHACVECSATVDAHGVLHIAHIEDYRVNGNNDPDNLRTLCPDCHAAETVPPSVEGAAAQRAAWDQYVRESLTESGLAPADIDAFLGVR